MSKFITVHRFAKANHFLEALTPWSGILGQGKYIFRGHCNADYLLTPTSIREESRKTIWECSRARADIAGPTIDNDFSLAFIEYQLIRDFYKTADARGLHVPTSDRMRAMLHQDVDVRAMCHWIDGDEWLPDDMLEVAALAQHYGIATRLLDWTYDPFVAGYFASKPSANAKHDLCVWGLNIDKLANLQSTVGGFPLKLVTPHYSGNPNLSAQSGLFTHLPHSVPGLSNIANGPLTRFSPVDRRPLDVQLSSMMAMIGTDEADGILVKMILSGSESVRLAKLLRKLGYGPARLFPGYEGVAMEIKERPFLK